MALLASAIAVAAAATWFAQRSTGAAQTAPAVGASAAPRLMASRGTSGGVSWAFDWHGALWLTLDGGRAWRHTLPGADLGLQQVQFVDTGHGWIIGTRDAAGPLAIQQTVDGGRTWRTSSLPSCGCQPRALSFYDARHGYVLATPESGEGNAQLFWTEDRGASWQPVARPGHVGSIMFVNRRDGFLVSDRRAPLDLTALYRTTDGGKTWAKQPVRPTSRGLSLWSFGRRLVVEDWTRRLWIYASPDAGAHWTASATSYSAKRPAVFAAGSLKMWFLATNRGLLITHDGGQSWNTIVPSGLPQSPRITGLVFSSPRVGWASVGVGALYRTTDGGQHWKPSACARPHLTCPADAPGYSNTPSYLKGTGKPGGHHS